MTIKGISILCAIGVATIVFLWFVPVGTRSAQRDIKGGDQWVIALSRPHYLIPREYLRTGGMNPIDIWSHFADPSFQTNRISYYDFKDIDGTRREAAVQGFNINKPYSNPEHREYVMAIRVGTKIFDYPTPGFLYGYQQGSIAKFHYIGQGGPSLYFYYPVSEHYADPQGKYIEAIIQITLPFESGKIEIVKSNETDQWASIVTHLRSNDLSPKAFNSLCDGKLRESHKFAQELFGKECR